MFVKNRRFQAVLCAALFLGMSSSVWGSLLISEPFNYAPGTNLSTQSPDGGTNTWAVAGNGPAGFPEPQTVSGALAVPTGFPPDMGNMVTYGGIGYTDRINLAAGNASFSTGSLFYSFSLQINNLGTLPTLTSGSQIIAGFNNLAGMQSTDITLIGAALWVTPGGGGTSTTNYDLGVSTSSSSTTRVYGAPTYSTGDTLFVVGARNFNSGVSTANAQIWVYDLTNGDVVPATAPGTDTATSLAGGGSISSLESFALYQPPTNVTNYFGTDGVNVGDLMVGTTWADVVPVPEPAAFGLLAPGIILFLRRRRM
jgi:hypothetical protein